MLDTGNFILSSASHVKLWDSFSQPTDTILPTQRLDLGTKVNARYSKMNCSAGRFHFMLGDDGNLAFYATSNPYDASDTYWRSNTVGSGFQLIFNQSGQVYLTARNGTVINRITTEPVPSSGYYQRAILEYDGVFRQYIHPKTTNSSSGQLIGWSRVSAPVPQNLCMSIAQQIGSGACGFNSYCTLGDDLRPRCQCPPGYTLLDSTNEMNGCIQDFAPQNCNGSRRETDQFDLCEMPNTNWPESDYERSTAQTEDWCREACLADCFCAVAIFGDGICWKKKIPLSNGRKDSSEAGTKALIKTVADAFNGNIYDLIRKAKGFPYLETHAEPYMRQLTVGEVVSGPLQLFHGIEKVANVVPVLRTTRHNGFPVIDEPPHSESPFLYGLIIRAHLMELLKKKAFLSDPVPTDIDAFEQISAEDFMKRGSVEHCRKRRVVIYLQDECINRKFWLALSRWCGNTSAVTDMPKLQRTLDSKIKDVQKTVDSYLLCSILYTGTLPLL
ncbi:hypothetical protein EUGRSUZ_C04360 [Eucalyptus grandis]|uniref:Uncharacterized protein n=2 Tax=Eucalyptus grandis TaxID=71139 RepID=A0ACC3LKB0_EUCGR|nr:hypothetical protein EUGRSUZ_C04360 [Eucalyptus grandis]